MKEQVWFKARVISSHGKHSFVEKEDGTVLEATRKGKKVDLVVGDIVECLQTSPEQVSDPKNRTKTIFALSQRRTKNQTACPPISTRWQSVFATRPSYNPHFIWKAMLAAETPTFIF